MERKKIEQNRSALAFAFFILCPVCAMAQTPNGAKQDWRAATKTQVINELLQRLNDHYVFLETAKKIEATTRERINKKEYDQITSAKAFLAKLTEDLRAVNPCIFRQK